MTSGHTSEAEAVRCVWDYHQLHHELSPADAIMVLGSHDLRVGERAAELYLAKFAPLVILSGGYGNFTRDVFTAPEADLLADVAERCGVPRESMLIENRSTNTGENIRFIRELLIQRDLSVNSAIAVQKPYMERRTFATFRRQWPELKLAVTSPRMTFEQYCNGVGEDRVINIMIGDLHRILLYPAMGYMEKQAVPEKVRSAFHTLIDAGYTQHLLPSPLRAKGEI